LRRAEADASVTAWAAVAPAGRGGAIGAAGSACTTSTARAAGQADSVEDTCGAIEAGRTVAAVGRPVKVSLPDSS